MIRYHGRIDDQYGIGFRRDKPTPADLKEALDELLSGRPIANAPDRGRGLPDRTLPKPQERPGRDLRQAGLADHPVLDARNATGRARSGRSRS